MKRVAIIGGGIAGLATAYYLQAQAGARNAPVEYTLIESAPYFGGKITSAHEQGFVVEGGPDSFITTKSTAIELCRALGLGDQLIGTNDAARKVYVWSGGRLRAMPDGVMLIIPSRLMPFIRSDLVSWPGKLRMGLDAFVPARRDDEDESLAHFVRRRLGREALDKIAEPMIAGIYVADAEYLSLKSTFPRFLDMEKKYGSLLRGVIAQRRAADAAKARAGNGIGKGNGKGPTSMFMTLRNGLSDLTNAITRQLAPQSLLCNRSVVAIKRMEDRYELTLNGGGRMPADAVVFATPAYVTADLVRDLDPVLASQLAGIRYVSTATVSLGFKRDELNHSLQGFGFVVPRSEKRQILACTWSSTKFDERAPEGHALVRAFIGGAHAEPLAEEDDATVAEIARREIAASMGITATPVLTRVYRWHKANPQYEVGHQARVAEVDRLAAQHTGLYLTGGAYHGVGIPDCIADGARVAEELVNKLEVS
ncbi:MAG: protoporphyrinogen oxidase [Anaerolineae bacterium]